MGANDFTSAETAAIAKEREVGASGRGGASVGIGISGSSFRSIWNKITGRGETDAVVSVGTMEGSSFADKAIAREVRNQERLDGESAAKDRAGQDRVKEINEQTIAALDKAKEQAKNHGLASKAHYGGEHTHHDKPSHGAPKQTHAHGVEIASR